MTSLFRLEIYKDLYDFDLPEGESVDYKQHDSDSLWTFSNRLPVSKISLSISQQINSIKNDEFVGLLEFESCEYYIVGNGGEKPRRTVCRLTFKR